MAFAPDLVARPALDAALSLSPLSAWSGPGAFDVQAQQVVEAGGVLHCPELAFAITDSEQHLFDPDLSDPKRKSIYLRGQSDALQGTTAKGNTSAQLCAMLQRYRDATLGLVSTLFPTYRGLMRAASTSFRPRPTGEGNRSLSWRKDDTRLHVDAFPSNPTNGVRILRCFTNVGRNARVWRVGEPFESMATRFLPRVPAYSAWRARLLAQVNITKRVRSRYDHVMLHLHDAAKADLDYQRSCQQIEVAFAPGTTWICYSDQVMHAAMSGQFMLEQTIYVPLSALAYPTLAPLAILERLTGADLLH